MRGTRWLLLVAIVAIIGGLVSTYQAQKQAIKAAAPLKPKKLPEDLNFVGDGSTWSQKPADRACEKYFTASQRKARCRSR